MELLAQVSEEFFGALFELLSEAQAEALNCYLLYGEPY